MRSIVFLFAMMSAACTVGDPTPGPGGDDDSSAGTDGGGDQNPGVDAGTSEECRPAASTAPDGHHNAGLACLTCHQGQAAGAPTFTVAGTLYQSSAGTGGVSAATMVVTDASGTVVEFTTANDGNFWTAQAVTFPLTVQASKCPDTKQMNGHPTTGDCNSCHTAQAAQGRIHLP